MPGNPDPGRPATEVNPSHPNVVPQPDIQVTDDQPPPSKGKRKATSRRRTPKG